MHDSSNVRTSAGKAKKIALRLLLGLLLVFLGLEAMSLLVAQRTEQQRLEVGMAGGQCETENRVPAWLSIVAGEDFHSFMDHPEIVAVKLKGDKIADANLARLPALPGLLKLDLQDAQVTSDGLKHIAQWRNIRTLNLGNTKVTDITPLAELPHLESLLLNFSQVRGKHLAGLSQLKNLKELGAGYIQVTDPDVVEIAKCTGLEQLSIAAAQLGEHGLQPLTSLSRLDTLVLKDASFNAADLQALQAAFPNLDVVK